MGWPPVDPASHPLTRPGGRGQPAIGVCSGAGNTPVCCLPSRTPGTPGYPDASEALASLAPRQAAGLISSCRPGKSRVAAQPRWASAYLITGKAVTTIRATTMTAVGAHRDSRWAMVSDSAGQGGWRFPPSSPIPRTPGRRRARRHSPTFPARQGRGSGLSRARVPVLSRFRDSCHNAPGRRTRAVRPAAAVAILR